MKKLYLLLFVFAFAACQKKTEFTLSRETIIKPSEDMRIQIVQVSGTPSAGPFSEAIIQTGYVGYPGKFRIETRQGPKEIEWPGIPGYYFQVNAYRTKDDEVLFVLSKLPEGWRCNYGEKKTEANQSPEPTTMLGTSAAEQPLVPSMVAAHL